MTRRDESGFALVTTLWFVALVAFVIVVIEGWITAAADRANALRQQTGAAAALIGATDRIIFDVIIANRSPRGLELAAPPAATNANEFGSTDLRWAPGSPYIALDGRAYRVGGGVARLQDEGGLYDLSNPKQASLEKLLGSYGVSLPEADRLLASLAAYTKKPADLRGAENTDADYARADLPAARHARLLTPWEPYRILGWAHPQALWRGPDALADLATTGPAGGLTVNTAPTKVLMVETEIDAGEAARIVAMRAAQPITNANDLSVGATARGESLDRPVEILPSSTIRLRLTAPYDPLERIVSVRLTPQRQVPYRIDYVVALPQDSKARAVGAASTVMPLPMPPTAR